MHILTHHKKIIVISTIGVFLVSTLYFSWDTLSATVINRLITSRINLNDGLVGHWTFDGPDMLWSSSTAEARDRSGQGNHGNVTGFGMESARQGRIGQALELDGSDDYVSFGDVLDFNRADTRTMSAWVKADTLATESNSNSVICKE